MGQERDDERLREEVAPPRRPPRGEDDPSFQARRQAADLKADAARRRSYLIALLWFCGSELAGAVIAAMGFHASTPEVGWALVNLGTFLGNASAFLGVWYIYLRRSARGDW